MVGTSEKASFDSGGLGACWKVDGNQTVGGSRSSTIRSPRTRWPRRGTFTSLAWDLRCEIREKLVAFIQHTYPESLPRFRASLDARLPNIESAQTAPVAGIEVDRHDTGVISREVSTWTKPRISVPAFGSFVRSEH